MAMSKPHVTHYYDIHGLVTVQSETRLPELEAFRVANLREAPTIRVRHGKPFALNGAARRVHYDDGLGSLRFTIDVAFADTIDVAASPLLASSPHVLYTNVVEPILRWTFVEKGFALVHGACVAWGDDAYLITARTDTGKTTTILRLLDNEPGWRFLSDDLTLLAPDGRVLMYPKPLTISRHTVSSVRAAALTRRERMTLGIQSRLHSRSGRRFGLLLARTRLPMATTNAVTQLFVPPPKYDVRRLIPGASLIREARLAGMIVIERGDDGEIELDQDSALEILMSNCEDAFGFPPYSTIREFLYLTGRGDLRPVECDIVASALQGRRAVLLRSGTRDWWQQIPAIAGCRPGKKTHEPRRAWVEDRDPDLALVPIAVSGSSD
ncbi:MAG: hypothetical protein QOF01_586 [Thermomicrobiales bacterium]|jgi:hypothetical protein|nr:hypothetical protein [Thermomicrobiales bacterium]MEA2594117.1 hypothetical protein [Thermomicrobiales bacterium]